MNTVVLENQLEDLTVIKGIKETRQAWLREHMQVVTYADLATLTADEIESALKADGRFAARKTIESWIKAAAELAEKAAETAVPLPDKPRFKEWQPFASFVVEFQERKLPGRPKEQRTTVHYMETDDGTFWPDLAHAELSTWIKKQVGETVLAAPAAEPVTEQSGPALEPIQLTVKRFTAWHGQMAMPQLVFEPERPFVGFLRADNPFSARIELLLSNVPERHTAAAQLEFHARNLSTGVNLPLPLVLESLDGGKNEATAVLDEAKLPAGFYRFGLLFKQAKPRNIQFVELPRLQVV